MNDVILIGKGKHAVRNIYPSLRELGIKIAAVASRNADEAQEYVRQWNPDGHGYGDYRKMLDQEPASHVIVVMQAKDAVPVVRECLLHHKQVFVEKPLGMNSAEAEAIADLVKQSGGRVQVGFMKRFAPCYGMIKDRIASQELGPVRSFRYAFDVSAAAFCKTDRDFLYFVAIHGLDLIRYLFGEPDLVRAVKNEAGEGCSYQILLRMQDGSCGVCSFENRSAHTREQERLEVTFENGYMAAEDLEHVVQRRGGTGAWQTLSECGTVWQPTLNPASGPARDLHLRGFLPELRSFCRDECADMSMDNWNTCKLCDAVLADLQ